MQLPDKLQEQIRGQAVAVSDSVEAIAGELSVLGTKTLVFTDHPGIFLHDAGGILAGERVCKQLKLAAPGANLRFTDQSRVLSGEVNFPGGVKVSVEFRRGVAKIADVLVAQRKHNGVDNSFATPLPVSIRSNFAETTTSYDGVPAAEIDASPDTVAEADDAGSDDADGEFCANVVVTGNRLQLLEHDEALADIPLDRLRSSQVSKRKIVLHGDAIVGAAPITALTIMLPSPDMATSLFRVLNGAKASGPKVPMERGLVAPVHAKGLCAEGRLFDGNVDAILSDDALELRSMEAGHVLGRFAFASRDVWVAGTAKRFILCCDAAGPLVVSGGVDRFRQNVVRSEGVRDAARRTLASGVFPLFLDDEPVICRVEMDGLTIRGTTSERHVNLPALGELRRSSADDQEMLTLPCTHDPADELRLCGESDVLQALYTALATQCGRKQYAGRPRDLIGAIVGLERDYFIYSLFGPLYEAHALVGAQTDVVGVPQPIALPGQTDAKLALANTMTKCLEPLRNHLDKVCYYFPSLLVKGDAGVCSPQARLPPWLKSHERGYRGVLMGAQPVLAEIRSIRELLLRVRGVEEQLGRDADYGGAALSAALGAVINPLFLLSAAQQAFSASRHSDAQKESQSGSADQLIERAVHQWNYLLLELLPALWHHLLEGLFPLRLQVYDEIRKAAEAPHSDPLLPARLARRFAVLLTYLEYPGGTSNRTRRDVVAQSRRLQEQLAYSGLQMI